MALRPATALPLALFGPPPVTTHLTSVGGRERGLQEPDVTCPKFVWQFWGAELRKILE